MIATVPHSGLTHYPIGPFMFPFPHNVQAVSAPPPLLVFKKITPQLFRAINRIYSLNNVPPQPLSSLSITLSRASPRVARGCVFHARTQPSEQVARRRESWSREVVGWADDLCVRSRLGYWYTVTVYTHACLPIEEYSVFQVFRCDVMLCSVCNIFNGTDGHLGEKLYNYSGI